MTTERDAGIAWLEARAEDLAQDESLTVRLPEKEEK